MKLSQYTRGILIASTLALSTLVTGCGTNSTDPNSTLQAASQQSNPATAGAIQILLLNDFGSVPTLAVNTQFQFASTNLSDPNSKLAGQNATTFVSESIPDPIQPPAIAITNSTVFAGNLVLTKDDFGLYNPSGSLTNSTVVNTAEPTTVWTAVTPDHLFAYEVSGLQTYTQSILVDAPSNITAINQFVNTTYPVATAGPNNTTAITNTSTPVFQRGFFGQTSIYGVRVSEDGTFTTPPSGQDSTIYKDSTFYYGLVHPSGSFLYVFGDVFGEGQVGDVSTFQGYVPEPAALDTAVIDVNPTPNDPTDPTSPVVVAQAGGTNQVQFRAHSVSSGLTRFNRGIVQVYSLNRNSGAYNYLDSFFLPAGISAPKYAVFGPGGNDLYISAYKVAGDATTAGGNNITQPASRGALVHYKLQTSTAVGTFGTSTVTTGIAGTSSGVISATDGGRVSEQTILLPYGSLGLAFSQGFKHLFVANQLDGFNPSPVNSTFFSANCGSMSGLDVDTTTGNVTLNSAIGVPFTAGGNGLSYPGYIVANSVFDYIYVSNNGGTLNLQTDAGQARFIPPNLAIAYVSSLLVDSANAGKLTLRNGARGSITDINLQTVSTDPSGSFVYAVAGAAPPPYDLSGTAYNTRNIAEAQATGYKGNMVAFKISGDGFAGGTDLNFGTTTYPVSGTFYQELPTSTDTPVVNPQ